MMCNFKVGQNVVCIGVPPQQDRHAAYLKDCGYDGQSPVMNEVYTVRDVFAHSTGFIALLLEELVNPELPYADGICEMSFAALFFRPLAERKTDISMFTAMLNTSKQGAPA